MRSSNLALLEPPALGPEEAEASGINRRAHTRRAASDLPWLTQFRLKYGPTAAVIDLSTGGAQIETEGYRLFPGATIVVQITTPTRELAVPARVLRCHVAGFTPHAIYRGGLAFKRPIAWPDAEEAGAANHGANGHDTNPLHEHTRLSVALSRRLDTYQPSGNVIIPGRTSHLLTIGSEEIAAARAVIDAPSARRAGAPFGRALSHLFQVVTNGLNEGLEARALVARIPDQLRRTVPARAIHVIEGTALGPAAGDEQIYFDVAAGDGPAAKLFVDFRSESHLEEWHFLYLKAAAQLVALVRKVDRAHAEPALVQLIADDHGTESDLPQGWNRVVVRYVDGRLMKGFSQDFSPPSGSLWVAPTVEASAADRINVPLGHLKAIFFVRNFEGDPRPKEAESEAAPTFGRRIRVTFLDGESLIGTTMSYNADTPGFFLRPVDARSNNIRVYVTSRAIRHVQFP